MLIERLTDGRYASGHSGNPAAQIAYHANYADIEPLKWAYLAGIVDGEGSIYVCYDKRNDIYFIEMSVSNTARSLIDWLLANFGGTEKLAGKAKRAGCPDQWAWVVRGRKAQPFISAIMPFLVIKQRQAVLACEFLDTYGNGGKRLSINAQRERIKAEISALNCLKGKPR